MVDRASKISYHICAASLKLPNGCIHFNIDFPKRGFDPFLHCCKACIGSLSVTAVISSGKLYRKILQREQTGYVPVFLMFCFLNTLAITYNATAALPFGPIVVIVLLWTLVTSPLLVLGGIAGKNSKAEFQAPFRTTKDPREIPPMPWYRGTVPQMAMAGFLPFSAIYIELCYIFASVWGHRIYTIYNILFIVFIILLIVTAFITVALTYFQLAAEDHEWWWRSSFAVDQLAYLSMRWPILLLCTLRYVQVYAKPRISLVTWLASNTSEPTGHYNYF
ncbi:putative phagocytic receptor 1b-like [Fagus crenata]